MPVGGGGSSSGGILGTRSRVDDPIPEKINNTVQDVGRSLAYIHSITHNHSDHQTFTTSPSGTPISIEARDKQAVIQEIACSFFYTDRLVIRTARTYPCLKGVAVSGRCDSRVNPTWCGHISLDSLLRGGMDVLPSSSSFRALQLDSAL